MPWTHNQIVAARIAEHDPDKLYGRNKSMKRMTKAQLHEMATYKDTSLRSIYRKRQKKKY